MGFDILKKEDFDSKDNMCNMEGMCLVQAYSKQPTKNGGSFIGGTLSVPDGVISFKSWSNSAAFTAFAESDLKGKVVLVRGSVNVYNGMKSMIVDSAALVADSILSEAGITADDFLFSKYNIDSYYNKFVSVMEKNLSENAFKVFSTIMETYGDRFKNEYAAIFYHDACRGGLLAHSLKVCQIASIASLYPSVLDWVGKDLLYLGCALHDIGKILEYNMGDISEEGKVLSHLVSGALIIANDFGDLISDTMGSKFLYELLSVVSCHHGEAGEPPRTVAAYVVHLMDKMDSTMTGLNTLLADAKKGDVQQFDGFKLS